jgi:hypothetical protein
VLGQLRILQMATAAHCLYCFEVLSAALEKRQPLELPQVEDLWAQYSLANGSKHEEDKQLEADDALAEDSDMGLEDEEDTDEDPAPPALRLPTISRLQASSPASASTSSSSSSTPSSLSTTSSQVALGDSSKSSSKSSFFSIPGRSKQPSPIQKEEEHPLFVTWNTISSRGHQSLRGCIGTFDAQPLQAGLKSYALTAYDPLSPSINPIN